MIDQDLNDKIEKMQEVEYYLFIEECGWFLWHTNHEMSHGRISESPELTADIVKIREIQEYLVSKLGKFGVNPESTKAPRDISEYWHWYDHWHKWHKETLTDEEWETVTNRLSKDEDISEFLPKRKWNEEEIIL